MYIELTAADPSGNTQAVLVNCDKVLGFEQKFHHDIGGNPIKDKSGYAKTYTEVAMRGTSFFVVETIETIKTLMEEKPII